MALPDLVRITFGLSALSAALTSNHRIFQVRLLLARALRKECKLVDVTLTETYGSRLRFLLFSSADNIGMFLGFFMSLVLFTALFVSLMGLIFLQLPTSESVFNDSSVIISSLFGSIIILKTRAIVLRHIRFATFYSLMQSAAASFKILLSLLTMFLVISGIASSAGLILPESLVNRIVLLILTLLIWAGSVMYYTLLGYRYDPQMLASACYRMASRERLPGTKLWWVLRGSNQMSKHFSRLGFPLKEASLNRILLSRILQKRNGNRVLNSLSRQLAAGVSPTAILKKLDTNRGVDLIDLGTRSRTKASMRLVNEYAPSLSIFVTVALFVLTYLRR